MTGVVQLFMMRPSGSVGIVFAILAVVVCALVFFIVLRILTAVLGSLGASVSRLCPGSSSATAKPEAVARAGMRPGRTCSNGRCRKVNIRTARFCAQCGTRM